MLWPLPLLTLMGATAAAAPSPNPIHLETKTAIDSSLANVHLTYLRPVAEEHLFTYGPCQSSHPSEAHHEILSSRSMGADRIAWVIPDDAVSGGCLSAWSRGSSKLLGRSGPVKMERRSRNRRRGLSRRDSIPMTNASGIDAEGPWFDGVVQLKNHEVSAVDAKEAKEKRVVIIGAGMAGLMTYLNLKEAGFNNIKILEATERIGGRLRTDYFGKDPAEYVYQEMGPMRFPYDIKYADTNETMPINDHKIVFQLANYMNKLNKDHKERHVNFIPFIQNTNNSLSYTDGIRKADGTVPTIAEVSRNASLAPPKQAESPQLEKAEDVLTSIQRNETFMKELGQNVYKAHKAYLDAFPGGDDWSEFGYLHDHLKFSLNVTEEALGGSGDGSFWSDIYDNVYMGAANWKTVDGGLNRLANSFHPLVDQHIRYHSVVQKLDFHDDQVTVYYKNNYTEPTPMHETFDYAFVAAPFTVVRGWRLPKFSALLSDAIDNMNYGEACKVALEFKSRFWEHGPNPIFGGCNTVDDIPGIGNTCYPSFKLNSTGPAAVLASYQSAGTPWLGYSEAEHVRYVLDAMAELHGDVVYQQYTGNYSRKCWGLDRFQLGSWASPEAGQHKAWIPAYFNTENNVVFVGEHTSYTHAWIASALESGVRGSVQLLLKLGLVDEAKRAARQWMGRWIDV